MRFIILIALLKEITCVNVVLMEKLTPCFTEYYSLEIVDGNRFRLAKTIPQLCPEGDLSYQLDEFHYVHSVVLFGGSFLTKGQIRYGTYFAVGCISNYEFHCGTYLEKRNVVFQGMRVNCESTKVAVNKISLKLSSIPFYMAELEVLTLASGKPDEVTMMYRGCFANFTSNEKKFLDDFQWCGKYCSNRSFTYSAIKGDICLCGNNVDVVDMKPDEQCDYPCHASEYSCGGEKTYSVYLVQVQLPYYKGCVNSSHASDLQSRDMTVVKCLQRCDDSYFAMLKNGNSCICTNDNSKFKTVSFEMCNIACLGDPNSNCGGTDHWSVYGTCFKTNPPTLPCSKLFHCARSWNEYGVCEGVCKENYFGEHCIERIPQEFEVDSCIRSDLCKYEKNTKCLYNSIKRSHDCVCINGYWDVEKSSLCVDIDECMFDSCFETSSMCENSIGSYNCRCKTGFQLNGLICQEIVRETSTRHKTHYETQPGLQFASNFSHPLSKVTRPLTKVTHPLTKVTHPLTNITPPLTFITHPPLSTHRPLSTQLLSNQSSSLCNYDEHSHKCSCKEGYWKNDNNSCEDIDECFYEACNNKSSICLNTMGSFVCKCYRDYIKITADVCITNATEVYPGLTRNSVFIILVTCFLMTNFLILLCYGWTIDNSDVLINRQE